MKYILTFAFAFCLSPEQTNAADDTFPSPYKSLLITKELSHEVPLLNESFLTANLKYNGDVCWRYGSLARGFSFSWAPDSSGFLFGITHVTRSMSLYYVHIESDGDVYPISIDLDSIQKGIAASLPEKQGASAPKAGADIENVNWISPKKCRLNFFQRFLGKNADSVLELNLEDPLHPVARVVSTEPK